MMDEDSCTEDELNSLGSRALPSQQMSASERFGSLFLRVSPENVTSEDWIIACFIQIIRFI